MPDPDPIVELAVTAIRPAPDNPRGPLALDVDALAAELGGYLDEDGGKELPADHPHRELAELALAVRAQGILQPLLVTPDPDPERPDGYLLVIGHRRWTAAQLAGLTTVPARVQQLTSGQRAQIMLAENLARTDLSPLEEARGYAAALAAEPGLSQRRLARRIGMRQDHISKRLLLLRLPPAEQDLIGVDPRDGGLTLRDAEALGRLAVEAPAKVRELLSPAARKERHMYHRTVEDEANRALASLHAARLAERNRKQLAERGVLVLEEPADGWYRGTARPLSRDGHATRCVHYDHLDVDGHQALGCHAATVCQHGEVVWLCADYRLHKTKGEDGAAAPTAAEIAEREQARKKAEAAAKAQEKALTAAAKARLDHLAGLVAPGAMTDAERLDAICWGLLSHMSTEHARLAGRVLDLTPDKEEGSHYQEWRGPVNTHAAGGRDQLHAAALAVALAVEESRLRMSWSRWSGPEPVRYFGLLEGHGYPVSDAERTRLERDQAAGGAADDAGGSVDDDLDDVDDVDGVDEGDVDDE